MKRILYFIFFFSSLQTVRAQVPGFLGMRMSLGYQVGFSPALFNMTSNYKQMWPSLSGTTINNGTLVPEQSLFAFNVDHTLQLEYITKRNRTFSASFTFAKSNCLLRELDYYDFPTNTSFTFPHHLSAITQEQFSVQYKFFRNDLAPIGLYLGYDIGMGFASFVVPTDISDATKNKKVGHTNYRLGWFVGRQHIIANKIIIDRGIKMDMIGLINFLIFRSVDERTHYDSMEPPSLTNYYKKQVARRLYLREAMIIYFGARYMF